MQAYNFCYNPFIFYPSASYDAKQQFFTPPQTYIPFNFAERNDVIKKIKFLEQRCSQLEIQNEDLKIKVINEKNAVVKIEAFDLKLEKNQMENESQQESCKSKKIKKAFKKRRIESQLIKNFRCPYADCNKDYASSLALNLHMRVKHGGGTKRERKQLMKQIIEAEIQGTSMPKINLNLPPNYLEEKKRLLMSCQDLKIIGQAQFCQ